MKFGLLQVVHAPVYLLKSPHSEETYMQKPIFILK